MDDKISILKKLRNYQFVEVDYNKVLYPGRIIHVGEAEVHLAVPDFNTASIIKGISGKIRVNYFQQSAIGSFEGTIEDVQYGNVLIISITDIKPHPDRYRRRQFIRIKDRLPVKLSVFAPEPVNRITINAFTYDLSINGMRILFQGTIPLSHNDKVKFELSLDESEVISGIGRIIRFSSLENDLREIALEYLIHTGDRTIIEKYIIKHQLNSYQLNEDY